MSRKNTASSIVSSRTRSSRGDSWANLDMAHLREERERILSSRIQDPILLVHAPADEESEDEDDEGLREKNRAGEPQEDEYREDHHVHRTYRETRHTSRKPQNEAA